MPLINITIFSPDNDEVYTSLTVDSYDIRTGNYIVTDSDGDDGTLTEMVDDAIAHYTGRRPSLGE